MSNPNEIENSPWCTRAVAAEYLGFKEVDSIDSRLIDKKEFVPGKIRYRLMADGSRQPKVRLWKADVLAMLPPFQD